MKTFRKMMNSLKGEKELSDKEIKDLHLNVFMKAAAPTFWDKLPDKVFKKVFDKAGITIIDKSGKPWNGKISTKAKSEYKLKDSKGDVYNNVVLVIQHMFTGSEGNPQYTVYGGVYKR